MRLCLLAAICGAALFARTVSAEEVTLPGFGAPTATFHDRPDVFLGVEAGEWETMFRDGSHLTFDEPEFAGCTTVEAVKARNQSQQLRLTGFSVSGAADYLLSAPRSLKAAGRNGEVTATVRFLEPVEAAGVGVCFATGSLRIAFLGEEGDTLAEYLVHGQSDPEQNGTWQDYFAVCRAGDELSRVAEIVFSRLNLVPGTSDGFAIDNLAWIAAPRRTDLALPPVVESDFSLLLGEQRDNVAPQCPAGSASLAWHDGVAVWRNRVDGTQYEYSFTPAAGLAALRAAVNGGPAVAATTAMAPELGGAPAVETLLNTRIEGDTLIAGYRWSNALHTLDVAVKLYLSGGSLCLEFASDQAGVPLRIRKPRPEGLHRIADGDDTNFRYDDNIAFFGFGGDGGYLPQAKYFYSYQADWTQTNSTAPSPVIHYASTLDGRTVAPLRDMIAITVADTLAKVLPSIPNPTSPYRRELASRMVLEYWYGHFDELGELLETYHRYGMDQLVVLVHRWQRAGFDRQLPDIMPPSAARGGEETLRAVIARAKGWGMRIALHDNYKDFYPDSPQWNPDDLMLCADGKPQAAWADSNEIAPSKILKYASPNMQLIREKLAPNAGYLDVHSAHLPWWRIDFRAGVPQAAMTAGTLGPNNALWQLARDNFDGPVYGESSPLSSWVHSGRIDAVMGATTHDNSLIVDFQLLKIRPLATNHGAGYFERWNPRGYQHDWELAPLLPLEYARYALHETAFLTSPTVDDKMKRKILPAATLYYQRRKLVERLADQPVAAIYYYTPENVRMTSSQAVLLPRSQSQRLEERFADGSVSYLNFAKGPWEVRPDLTLAPLSFYAEGPGFQAESNCRAGVYLDYWGSPAGYYLNSRNYDWALEPQGSSYHGRNEGGAPVLHNNGQTVRRGAIATDTAVALEPEEGAWRLRFFPRGRAGSVEIGPDFAPGRIAGAVALDADGREIAGSTGDEVELRDGGLRIFHRDPEVWSYRLTVKP